MAMDPELKAKWVAALRSGKYKQGRGYLHRIGENNYCCLGVLCEVAEFLKIDHDFGVSEFVIPGQIPSTTAVTPSFFGFKNKRDVKKLNQVMTWNDSIGKNHKGFKAIATYIEKHF